MRKSEQPDPMSPFEKCLHDPISCAYFMHSRPDNFTVPIIDTGSFCHNESSKPYLHYLKHRTLQEKVETIPTENTNLHKRQVRYLWKYLLCYVWLSIWMCTSVQESTEARKGCHSLGLELQMVVNHYVNAWNWTWVLWKSGKCSQPLSHCYNPIYYLLSKN